MLYDLENIEISTFDFICFEASLKSKLEQVTIWASLEGAFFDPIIMVDLLVDYSGDLLRFRIDQIWVITSTGDTSYQALIINMREQYSSVQL